MGVIRPYNVCYWLIGGEWHACCVYRHSNNIKLHARLYYTVSATCWRFSQQFVSGETDGKSSQFGVDLLTYTFQSDGYTASTNWHDKAGPWNPPQCCKTRGNPGVTPCQSPWVSFQGSFQWAMALLLTGMTSVNDLCHVAAPTPLWLGSRVTWTKVIPV